MSEDDENLVGKDVVPSGGNQLTFDGKAQNKLITQMVDDVSRSIYAFNQKSLADVHHTSKHIKNR